MPEPMTRKSVAGIITIYNLRIKDFTTKWENNQKAHKKTRCEAGLNLLSFFYK